MLPVISGLQKDGLLVPIKFNSVMKTISAHISVFLLAGMLLFMSCSPGLNKEAALPRSLTLSQATLTLHVGETHRLAATVLPDDADKTVQWLSMSEDKVSVDKDGLVSALAVGTAYVVAQTQNGIKSSCLVKVIAWEGQSYGVSLFIDGNPAPQTLYGWPGHTVTLEARSDDGKQHNYRWNSSSDELPVQDGLLTFGLGTSTSTQGYAWYAEAVVRATSADGYYAYVNAVSSVSERFRFGVSTEKVGSNVVMLAGNTAEVVLSYYDGNGFTPLPSSAYTIYSQDTSVISVTGHVVSTSGQTVGSTALYVTLCGQDFRLCNIIVEKDGSESSSGETYLEETVNW